MHNLWRYMTYSIYSGIRDHMHTQVFLSSLISFLSGPLMSIFLSTHSEKILSCVLRESSRNSSSSSNRFWVLIQAHLGTFYFVFSFFPFFFFFLFVFKSGFLQNTLFWVKKKNQISILKKCSSCMRSPLAKHVNFNTVFCSGISLFKCPLNVCEVKWIARMRGRNNVPCGLDR
jgi:hypothetical protein